MKSRTPTPRKIPQGGGFSIPHAEMLRGTRRLLSDLERALADAIDDAMEARRTLRLDIPIPDSSRQTQIYSCAVQVFAVMTAEAALNLYGVLYFGGPDFQKHYERRGPVKKFKALMRDVRGLELGPEHAGIVVLQRLVDGRNTIVHPQIEESGPGSYFPDPAARDPRRRVDVNTAREALSDAEAFLRILSECDPSASIFLTTF